MRRRLYFLLPDSASARGMMDDPRWAWHAARELGAQAPYPAIYQRCHPSVWKP